MKLIDPLKQFGSELNSVQSPSRYIGGEYALTVKPHSGQDDFFNVGIAFPDLYEIAMSNLAVKIIYNGLNASIVPFTIIKLSTKGNNLASLIAKTESMPIPKLLHFCGK